MARLQDFQSVTPATSDNLLIVQSQGQGLATLNAVGQKVANDTTISSLNTTDKSIVGAINELKTLADKLTPTKFRYVGQLLDSYGGTMKGCGEAQITLQNGIARIDFGLMIETADDTSKEIWGINSNFFTSVVGKTITPSYGGVATFYTAAGAINGDRHGYCGNFGTLANPYNYYWKPSRIYKSGSGYSTGSWASGLFGVGQRIIGTIWGTYT